MNILTVIRRAGQRAPERVAIRHGDTELSYRELLEQSPRFASFLIRQGGQPGQRVAKFVDGWFRTSDLVRAEGDGYLYYVDRIDDMIISGGENVFPQIVGGYLAACALIAEVAVTGTRYESFSQQVTAIVVPSGPDVTVEDFAADCESDPNLRGIQRPRRIELAEAIPRTATNKVDRPLLKQTLIYT